jgi:hypothetical protein
MNTPEPIESPKNNNVINDDYIYLHTKIKHTECSLNDSADDSEDEEHEEKARLVIDYKISHHLFFMQKTFLSFLIPINLYKLIRCGGCHIKPIWPCTVEAWVYDGTRLVISENLCERPGTTWNKIVYNDKVYCEIKHYCEKTDCKCNTMTIDDEIKLDTFILMSDIANAYKETIILKYQKI